MTDPFAEYERRIRWFSNVTLSAFVKGWNRAFWSRPPAKRNKRHGYGR